MFGAPTTPETVIEKEIESLEFHLKDHRDRLEQLRADVERYEDLLVRVGESIDAHRAALKRLKSGKTDVGTFTATLKLDTTVFDKQVAAAEAAIAGLNGIA